VLVERTSTDIFPAKHFVTTADRLQRALRDIRHELEVRLKELEAEGKLLEAQRLRQRTNYDLEMMEQQGYCAGIENYSRHLAAREPGDQPSTLLDYFPDDWLLSSTIAYLAATGAGHVQWRPPA
jgi:excinuclease ABC subunit B